MPILSDTENTSNVSHFSRIVSTEVTKIINVPVMSSSETNGIAGCLYNVTIPNIDNWRRFAQGSRFGAESLAEIYSNPLIAQESRFQFDGWSRSRNMPAGRSRNRITPCITPRCMRAKTRWLWTPSALKRLEQWRVRASLPAIGHTADYVGFASALGLGNAAPNRIEIKNIGR